MTMTISHDEHVRILHPLAERFAAAEERGQIAVWLCVRLDDGDDDLPLYDVRYAFLPLGARGFTEAVSLNLPDARRFVTNLEAEIQS